MYMKNLMSLKILGIYKIVFTTNNDMQNIFLLVDVIKSIRNEIFLSYSLFFFFKFIIPK
jgi:hypothetical protein